MAACNKHREECEEYTARMEKHLEECQKAEDDEPDVLDIVRNKEAGHRQTSPASAPVPAPRTRRTPPPPPPPPAAATASHTPPPFTPSSPPPAYEKCDLCSQVFHHQPAEGHRQALSPQQLLRCHLIAAHKIAGGALEKCAKCPSFSALNKHTFKFIWKGDIDTKIILQHIQRRWRRNAVNASTNLKMKIS